MGQDDRRIRHLLERFGLGASPEDLAYYGKDGWEGAIERLLNDDRPDVNVRLPASFYDGSLPGLRRMSQLQGHWYRRLLITRRPLQHRMLLFWHDHFATASSKVRLAQAMVQHMETLYVNGIGSFRELLVAVAKDPAMVIWLDNANNVKGSPNENFARELLELFTLGADNGYSEEDIVEVARAFTGWGYSQSRGRQSRGVAFRFDSSQHDDGTKTILEKTDHFTGEMVIDLLCQKREVAEFIATKVWDYFASTKPQPGFVRKLTDRFIRSGLEIKDLLREVMESEEFYSEAVIGARIKSPVDLCVSTARQIGVQTLDRADAERPMPFGSLMKVATSEMGMELLEPPDVSGWPSGLSWISSATVRKRINWASFLFLGEVQSITRNQRSAPPFTAYEFIDATTDEQLVETLMTRFNVELDREQLKAAIAASRKESGGSLTRSNFNRAAAAAAMIIFAAPQFQFH